MGFVQGFLATLTLDTVDITLFVTDVSFDQSKTALDKSVMDSSGDSVMLPGLQTGTLSINGHIDQANLNALETSWAKDTAVAFTLEVNEGLATDAEWAGNIAMSDFTKATTFDGNWAFSISGDTSGAVTYTPSVAV